jgi:hypothetical protein
MPLANVDESLKRLGAFAGMLNDCSALVVLHVDESGHLTFHRSGNIYAQLGAVDMMAKGLTNSLAEDDWDPDAEN